MILKESTGFRTAFLAAFPTIFNGGAIFIYAGARPGTADQAAPSDPIGIVTHLGMAWNPVSTGYGLRFIQQGPYIVFDPTLSAQITATLGGSATWWRLVAPGDDGTEPSLTFPRVDGDVGDKSLPANPPESLLLDDLSLIVGIAIPLTYFLYTIPPIPGE